MDRLLMASVERAEDVNLQTGEFPMILATDGEATDGDILSIEGAKFAKAVPLQMSHINDPTATLGTIRALRRDLQSHPKKLRATGQIETEGEGPLADIRRDVLFMMSRGHVRGISVRWDPIEFTRRVNLPEDHPAYVNEAESSWQKRYGYFHKNWRVLEGSVVAVQADPASMVGRAEETDGAVSDFWMRMAESTVARAYERPDPADYDNKDDFVKACIPLVLEEGSAEGQDHAIAMCNSMWENRAMDDSEETERTEVAPTNGTNETPTAAKPPTREALQAALASYIRELKTNGLGDDEIESVVSEQLAPDPYEGVSPAVRAKLEALDNLAARFAALEEGLKNKSGVPSPPEHPTTRDILEYLEARMRESTARAQEAMRLYVQKKRGAAEQQLENEQKSARQRLREDGEALLKSLFDSEEDRNMVDSEAVGQAVDKLNKKLEQSREYLQKRLELERDLEKVKR